MGLRSVAWRVELMAAETVLKTVDSTAAIAVVGKVALKVYTMVDGMAA